MKLTSIEFENFKSIKRDTLNISHNCMILVGKNEAGKSNVLKGIAGGLSDSAYALDSSCKRKRHSDEADLEYYIEFNFDFLPSEISDLQKKIDEKVKVDLFLVNGKTITNHEFIERYCNRGLYHYDIVKNTREGLYYEFPEEISLANEFIELKSNFEDYKAGEIIIKPVDDPSVLGTNLDQEALLDMFGDKIVDIITEKLPTVYYWKSDPSHLLPPSVSINEFFASPNTVPSLRNIFHLAGYKPTPQLVAEARKDDGDLSNLLDNVSKKATKVFQQKWPDLKGVTFVLNDAADEIRIKIQEAVKYNFSDRSDGFKHFISILLALSTRVELQQIHNAIILIDEPDNHLYPTAAKYLRKELINLATNNIIIYATHSPFMIDPSTLSRHVIVSKTKDITTFKHVDNEDQSYLHDHVILNAIGTSLFEYIKQKNILFEGWSDYNFFKKALKIKNKKYVSLKNFFDNIGVTFGHGAPSIKVLTPILKLARKDIFIVSDADDAAQQARTSYVENNGYQYQHWFTFKDLGINDKITIEDFILGEDLFQNVLVEMGKEPVDFSQRSKKGVLGCVANVLKNKEEKQHFKNMLAEKLTSDKIDPSYYELLEALKNKIENATEDD